MVARRMGLYQTTINLPMWLDLAWLVSATCKKKKCIGQDRRTSSCSPGWKARGNQLVLSGSGVPLNRYGGSVKDQMTLLSAKEGTWREIKWQPSMKGQVETDL